MRDDVIDDARRGQPIIALALGAERMLGEEQPSLALPAGGGVERTDCGITFAVGVAVALTLVASSNRAMDGRTLRHAASREERKGMIKTGGALGARLPIMPCL